MAKIEDHPVTCRFRLFIEDSVIFKNGKKIFKQVIGLVEVVSDLLTFLFGIVSRQGHRHRVKWVQHRSLNRDSDIF